METLIDDLLHAQPDALLMIAGLAFITIALVGSIKAYFDPGKAGRIAAGVVGGVLLITGLVMYKPAAAAPTTSADQVAAQSSSTAGQTTTYCYIPGKWPVEIGKSMAAGDNCTGPAGKPGKAVVASRFCTYTSGPKSGTSEEFKHQMYVGFSCTSDDKQSKGTALAPKN
jgi:hypothetical protein